MGKHIGVGATAQLIRNTTSCKEKHKERSICYNTSQIHIYIAK